MAECAGTHRQGRLWACALLAGLCMAAPAAAQSAVGGIVKDANGRVVVGALVTVKELASRRERQTRSSSIGSYEVARLSPGVYSVTVKSEYCEPSVGQVELVRHVMARLDVTLTPTIRHTEQITVRGDAVARAPLATRDLSVGSTFSREAIESSPLTNGRTVQSMQMLVPGIVFTEAVGNQAQFTAGGQQRFANRLTVDGMSADLAFNLSGIGQAGSGALPALATSGGTQTIVPIDAIEDIQVRTTNASPEFARTPGAQTAIVTRAGGDRFAGAAFTGLRPSQLAASNWFSNSGQAPQRAVRLWNTGASAGGPLTPRRLHYFATWEKQALDRPATTTVQVPSLAVREAASGIVRSVLDAFPKPNGRELDEGLSEYSGTFPTSSNLWTLSLRIDGNLSERHRLFARGNWGDSSGDALGIPSQIPFYSFSYKDRASARTGTVGLTSAFPSLNHDLRVNVSTNRGSLIANQAPFGGTQPLPSILGPAGVAAADTQLAVFLFASESGFVLSGRVGAGAQRQVQVVDTWSFVRGSHEWRVGLDYSRSTASSARAPVSYTYRFTDVRRFVEGETPFVLAESRAPARARLERWALFAQDTWRISPRLSLNYGLRYSVKPPPSSLTDTQPLLVRFETLPRTEALPSGAPPWKTSWTDIAARIAAAYQLNTGEGRETVLRAGWSLTFDELTAPGAGGIGQGYPFVSWRFGTPSTFTANEDAWPLSIPAPFSEGATADYYSFPRDLHSPRTYQWQAGLDRSLGRAHRLSLAYVGAAGRDLIYAPVYYPQAPLQGHTVRAFTNMGRSDYHALLGEFVRRLSKGLEGRVMYSWSHTIDTDSGEMRPPLPPPDLIAPSSNRGSADFDLRHVLRIVASYRLPASAAPNWLRSAIAEWQVDIVGTMRSAAPFNLITSQNLGAGYGYYSLRPDVVPGEPLWLDDQSAPGGRILNPDAFRNQGAPRQGTQGRNSLRAFPLRQIDLSLSRSKRFGERIEAQLRIDAFNVLNIPAFGPPSTTLTTPEFGFGRSRYSYADRLGTGTLGGGLAPILQVGGPRSIQVGVRVAF